MANPEHLAILKQGVKVWNQWRKDNPDIKPDFSNTKLRADLVGVNLSFASLAYADLEGEILIGADFRQADLLYATLTKSNLSGVNLSGASIARAGLSEVNLEGANLSRADLLQADLRGANLNRAVLFEAYLSGANIRKASLTKANLRGAKLSQAALHEADLREANLTEAVLIRANLTQANLSGANLSKADLKAAILWGANLSEAKLIEASMESASCRCADLNNADLEGAALAAACLINTNLNGAKLIGTHLWETQRAGWSIKGVVCDHAYWDRAREEKTFYSPGEFERLYTEKTKIRLFYKDGINPLEIATLSVLIKHLEERHLVEERHLGCSLRLISIYEDSGGVVVELAIDNSDLEQEQLEQLKFALESEAKRAVEYQHLVLAEKEKRLQLEGALRQSDTIIDKLILRPSHSIQGHYMGNTYNVPGQAAAVGDSAYAHDNTFNQIANHLQSVDLTELAKQLGELRQALAAKQGDSPRAAIALPEVAKAEIAAQEKKPSKVVEHLKSAGQWTLDFAKEVGKDVVVEAIKQSMGAG